MNNVLELGKTYTVKNTRIPYCCAEILPDNKRKLCVFPVEVVDNFTHEVYHFLEMPDDYNKLEQYCHEAGKEIVEIITAFAVENGKRFVAWVEERGGQNNVSVLPTTMKVVEVLEGFYIVKIHNRRYEVLGDEHFSNLFEVLSED